MNAANTTNTMNEIPKKILLLNVVLSQAIIVGIGILLIFAVFENRDLTELFSVRIDFFSIFVVILGSGLLILLQLLFHKFLAHEKLFDEINMVLMERFSLKELFWIFLGGSIAEEFLFRGIIQTEFGILIASIVFTITHFRYHNKLYIIAEVFLMGLLLGLIYTLTKMLWVPIVCHLTVNFATAFLLKKGYLKVESEI